MKARSVYKLSSFLVLSLVLTGCSASTDTTIISETETYQSSVLFSDYDRAGFIAADQGVYYQTSDGYLRFIDNESGQDVLVCSTPNCLHNSWNETTPAEQRCAAYIPSFGQMRGVCRGNDLYIFLTDYDQENARHLINIQKSDLSRNDLETVAVIPCEIVNSYALIENDLYIPASESVKEMDETGYLSQTEKNSASLYRIDLETGQTETLADSGAAYNSSWQILEADENKLILCYSYVRDEDKTEAGVYKPTFEYYFYDLASHEKTSAFEDLGEWHLVKMRPVSEDTWVLSLQNNDAYQIRIWNEQTGEMNLL